MNERKLTVYFTMALNSEDKWYRVGIAYRTRKIAETWMDFVSKSQGGRQIKVEECALLFIEGKLDDNSVKILDEKFNLTPPTEKL